MGRVIYETIALPIQRVKIGIEFGLATTAKSPSYFRGRGWIVETWELEVDRTAVKTFRMIVAGSLRDFSQNTTAPV